jgi:hypothetical protein
MSPDRLGRLRRGGLAVVVVEEVGPAFGDSSRERPRSLSGPLLPGPETRSLPRGCRYVSRPHGALKRETGASFKSLCFSWRTVKAFRQSNRHSLLGGADLYPDRVDSLRLHGSAREAGKAEDRVELPYRRRRPPRGTM